MLRTRIIPALLLRNESLVKTIRFGRYRYIGDPANTVRIFNELEVDELLFLDITATVENRGPNTKVLRDIANECFMPLAYGGGIRTLEEAKAVFDTGFEKVAINTQAVVNPNLISSIAGQYGSQAVVVSIDVKKSFLGGQTVRTYSGSRNARLNPVTWAKEVELRGAGEILLTSVDREGTWQGFDIELVAKVVDAVSIPVIAHGGAGSIDHVVQVVRQSRAAAVALGSLLVYQKKDMGVLVNFPDRAILEATLAVPE